MPSGLSYSTGSGNAYGKVPDATAVPPSQYQQVQQNDPGLAALEGGSNAVIAGQTAGQLSPQTINAIKNASASFGVSAGVPGSQFQGHQGLATLGLNVEDVQNQGVGNYLKSLSTVGGLQENPETIAEVNMHNADLAAAPDPAAAAQHIEDLYQKHWQQDQDAQANLLQEQFQNQESLYSLQHPANSATNVGPQTIPYRGPQQGF